MPCPTEAAGLWLRDGETIAILDVKEAQHLEEGVPEPVQRSNPGPGSRAREISKMPPSFLGGYGTEQKGEGMKRNGRRKGKGEMF